MDIDSPAHAFAITPNDDNDLTHSTRALYVGGAGDIVAVTTGGDEVTIKAAAAGSVIPIRLRKVKATGTSANMYLLGLY